MSLQEICNNILIHNEINSQYCKSWIINLNDFSKYNHEIKKHISDTDMKRVNEIKIEHKKNLFCLRKGITRIILSNFLNMNPKEIELNYDKKGKPFISKNDYTDFYYNLSHSQEYLFLGISNKGNIGVDVEKVKLNRNYALLAKSILSREEEDIFNTYSEVDKLSSLYKAWVQKEAISKALGLGISIGFNTFSVDINPKLIDMKYTVALEGFGYNIEMTTKFNSDYFLSTAVII